MSGPAQRAAYFLVGPTAVGKSAVAQVLAEARNSVILSADSMLIYRGMDIGTAKPTPVERGDVPYYGVDLVDPEESFSVWDYRLHALDALREVGDEGELIVTGGTGLYVKSLTHGLADRPGADGELRAEWERRLEEEGIEALRAAARAADPKGFAALADTDNPRRLIRALESAGASSPSRSWQASRLNVKLVGLSMAPELLSAHIVQRVDAMYAAGLLEEVERLLGRDRPLSDTARQAIGYAEAIDVIEGRSSREDAMQRTVVRTRRLAKRQRTWFRNQADVAWVEVTPESTVASLVEQVSELWREYGPAGIRYD